MKRLMIFGVCLLACNTVQAQHRTSHTPSSSSHSPGTQAYHPSTNATIHQQQWQQANARMQEQQRMQAASALARQQQQQAIYNEQRFGVHNHYRNRYTGRRVTSRTLPYDGLSDGFDYIGNTSPGMTMPEMYSQGGAFEDMYVPRQRTYLRGRGR